MYMDCGEINFFGFLCVPVRSSCLLRLGNVYDINLRRLRKAFLQKHLVLPIHED
jgi:hypothetical protein